MDSRNFGEWINESRIIKPLRSGKETTVLDNASGHKKNETVKEGISTRNTKLGFLPKMRRIYVGLQIFYHSEHKNPGKKFGLQLSADVIREVQNDLEDNGVLYTRKATIVCDLALNLNGRWVTELFSPHLQEIIKKYPENFNGTSVADSMGWNGASTEMDSKQISCRVYISETNLALLYQFQRL